MNKLSMALLGLLIMATGQVQAELGWAELSTEQQTMLQPHASQWEDFTDARRQTILKGVDRYLSMNANERTRVQQRFQRWQSLPEADKLRIRARFKTFRQLPPAEQRRIRERYEQFVDLPVQRRLELRNRWKELSPERRRRILKRLRRRD